MNFSFTDLENKNKTELINFALLILKEKHKKNDIDPNDYLIRAFKNEEEVYLTFKRWIRCIPKNNSNQKVIYEFTIELISTRCLPLDSLSIKDFYQPSKSDIKTIGFIKKYFGNLNPAFLHSIYETDNQFILERVNTYSFGRYIIDKVTKQTSVDMETSFAPEIRPALDNATLWIEILS